MGRDQIAVDPFRFLGEPFDKGRGVGNLAPGLGQGFALLGRHDPGQVFLMLHDQFKPAAQDNRALLGRAPTPGRLRRLRRGNGTAGLLDAHIRHAAQPLGRGRVENLGTLTALGFTPGAIDESLLAKQFGRLQFHGNSPVRNGVMHLPHQRLKFQTC